MVWVDPSHRAVELDTPEKVAAQAERPKLAIVRVDNGDGTFSYYQAVHLANPEAIVGPFEVTIGGATPSTDSIIGADGAERTVLEAKIRLGAEGRNDGLVDERNPLPMADADTRTLLAEILGELREMNVRLAALTG